MRKMAEKKSKEREHMRCREPYHAQNGREEVQRKRTHELENTGSETFSYFVVAMIFYCGESFFSWAFAVEITNFIVISGSEVKA